MTAAAQIPRNRPLHRLNQIKLLMHLRRFQLQQFHCLPQRQRMVIGQVHIEPAHIDQHAIVQATEAHIRPEQSVIFAQVIRRGMHKLHCNRRKISPG